MILKSALAIFDSALAIFDSASEYALTMFFVIEDDSAVSDVTVSEV